MSSHLEDGGDDRERLEGATSDGAPARQAGERPLAGIADRLGTVVDELLATDPTLWEGGEELCETLVGLHREQQRLAAAQARLAAAYDTSRAWAVHGGRSAAGWLAHRTRTDPREMRALVWLGRSLRLMPTASAALREGRISACHARRLARLARNKRTAEAFARDEGLLVGYAAQMDWPDFERAVSYWHQLADPDGVEDNAAADEANRRVHLSEGLDGTGLLDGTLTPVGHAIVSRAMERICDDLFHADWGQAQDLLGREPTVDELPRTPAQRRHDALVELAQRAITAPKDGKRPAPLISVLVGYETLAGRICQLAGTNQPVTPGTVAKLFDDNADTGVLLERAVFGAPSRVTDISHQRLYTGGLRRIIQIRDRECQWPGCHQPAPRCEIDHIQPWAHGGATTADNGRLYCGHHNRHRATREPPAPSP